MLAFLIVAGLAVVVAVSGIITFIISIKNAKEVEPSEPFFHGES